MAFVKREIKDRVVQYPRRYQLVEVQPGIFDLIPVTGTVTEEGTPVNKELLQRYEDGLDAALEKTGDGKDVIVTFTEAATEAHITSGEKLSVMFGKILKMFKGKAPNSHASSATTYGVGTTANYGHVKTINALTQTSHVNGNALSAYQGYLIKCAIIDRDETGAVLFNTTSLVSDTSVVQKTTSDMVYQLFKTLTFAKTTDIHYILVGITFNGSTIGKQLKIQIGSTVFFDGPVNHSSVPDYKTFVIDVSSLANGTHNLSIYGTTTGTTSRTWSIETTHIFSNKTVL